MVLGARSLVKGHSFKYQFEQNPCLSQHPHHHRCVFRSRHWQRRFINRVTLSVGTWRAAERFLWYPGKFWITSTRSRPIFAKICKDLTLVRVPANTWHWSGYAQRPDADWDIEEKVLKVYTQHLYALHGVMNEVNGPETLVEAWSNFRPNALLATTFDLLEMRAHFTAYICILTA